MFGRVKRIHMIGIGGIGMSGIARILKELGFEISGSDIVRTELTKELENAGIKVYYQHKRKNVENADVVVYSSAIPSDNPEIVEAKKRGIPVIPRAEMLAELMRMRYSVAVSGTHGKTTTTSMIASIFEYAGLDPTIVIGGRVVETGRNAKLGNGNYLIAEADESDKSFLKLFPTIVVVTNIEPEHLEHYESFDEVKRAYIQFIHRTPFYGVAVLCADNPGVREIMPVVERRKVTYGIYEEADIKIKTLEKKNWGARYTVIIRGKEEIFELQVPGEHNIQNSLAAIGVSQELEIPLEKIKEALKEFKGVKRRMEKKKEKKGILYIDDYAHHPTEIKATLRAVKEAVPGRRIVVLFQPHRYTRTYYLSPYFRDAFVDADYLVITRIYPASEPPIPRITGKLIYDAVKKFGIPKALFYIENPEEIIERFLKELKEGDVFVTLGAGDVWKIGERILEKI